MRRELKKISVLLLSVIIAGLLITSCSQDLPLDGKVCFVTIALDYDKNSLSDLNSKNDQEKVLQAVRPLLTDKDRIKVFSSFGEPSAEDPENYVTISRFESFIDKLDLEEKDVLVIHYSGHGDTDGSLAFDSNVDRTGYTLYKPSTLLNKLNSLKCNKVLLLDSCYSGRFVAEKPYLSDNWSNAIKNFGKTSDTSKLWVISACNENQTAPDEFKDKTGAVHEIGILSYCLGEYLNSERRDYTVQGIYEKLWNYVKNGVTKDRFDLYYYHATCNLEPQTNLTPYDLVLFRRTSK